MNAHHNAAHGYVVGIDFGTLSGRAVVVRVFDGAKLASAVHEFGHGVVDRVLPYHRQSRFADQIRWNQAYDRLAQGL